MDILSLEEFCKEIKNRLVESNYYKDEDIFISKVEKVNIGTVTQLTLITNSSVSPSITMNGFYEEYREGSLLSNLSERIASALNTACNNEVVEQCIQNLSDYNAMKDKIVPMFVNTEQNAEMLKSLPHIEVADLSVIFKLNLYQNGNGELYSARINDNFLKAWNITVEDLHKVANENLLEKNEVHIEPMIDFMFRANGNDLKKVMGLTDEEIKDFLRAQQLTNQYIVTNKLVHHGAYNVMLPNVMHELQEKIGSDYLCVLPSSIHEVMVLPFEEEYMQTYMDMVLEANETVISQDEKLSDNFYIMDANAEKIIQAKEWEEYKKEQEKREELEKETEKEWEIKAPKI